MPWAVRVMTITLFVMAKVRWHKAKTPLHLVPYLRLRLMVQLLLVLQPLPLVLIQLHSVEPRKRSANNPQLLVLRHLLVALDRSLSVVNRLLMART